MFNNIIGSGTFGEIFLQPSGNTIIKRQDYYDIISAKEIYLLSQLNHPSILSPIRAFKFGKWLNIEMSYEEDLPQLTEGDFSIFAEDMLEVVRYLHCQNISHRDICNSNIIYNEDMKTPYLIDFGTATQKEKSKISYCHVNFTAPETLTGLEYDSKLADIWSLGMVFLRQISNFDLSIGNANYYYYRGRFGFGLDQAGIEFNYLQYKDLVQDMLQFDPEKRLTAEQLLEKYFPSHEPDLHKALLDEKIMRDLEIGSNINAVYLQLGIKELPRPIKKIEPVDESYYADLPILFTDRNTPIC